MIENGNGCRYVGWYTRAQHDIIGRRIDRVTKSQEF